MATASIKINGGTAGLAATDLPLNTLVALSNADDSGVSTHEWVIVSQPAGGQDDLDPPYPLNPIVSYGPAPTFTPTKEGSYLIRLTVNKNMADEATDTTICAVRELLTGDRIPAPQETTEVNEEYGWATAAVTKILQRVTRMSDAGIFVAQNDSSGTLALGQVVHLNGMSTIGTGTNERPIPTVGLALANDLAKVDGPLGVVVGDRDGGVVPVGVGEFCRVMVMGGLPAYDLGDTAAAGDPVFVDDTGHLSLAAGTYVRQVGDVAKVVSGTVYDIAISAGANSIPRGNAGGDLSGQYPDPTVAKINNTTISTAGGSLTPGSVLRVTGASTADWGAVDLADADAVTGILPVSKGGTGSAASLNAKGIVYATSATQMATTVAGTSGAPLLSQGAGAPIFSALALNSSAAVTGTLPVDKGGTGQASALTANGLVYASSTSAMASLALPVSNNSVLLGSSAGSPSWAARLPLASGGTNADLSGIVGVNGVVCKASSTSLGLTAAGATGSLFTPSVAGVPTWTAAGSAGQILQCNGGLSIPTWEDFAEYFDAQYAGSSTATDSTFSTTGPGYASIVSTTRSCKRGMVQVTPMAIADGLPFDNYITTATNNTSSTVKLKFVVTYPDASIQNYIYQFRSSVAHNNNQITGSITFPSFTFYTAQTGNHTVELLAELTGASDTFTANAIALRISQG